tara:strand:+ start:927 stop:1169 length:243 start_codon:yes stop_codon:yes gene_type:complete
LRGFFVTLIKIKGMNRTVKTVLLIAGIILLIYGICTMIIPKTEISKVSLDLVKIQNNSISYITIGFGIVAIFLSLIKEKD